MTISVQDIENELRTLLRGGIRTQLDEYGLIRIDEKVVSIFEQLALILLLHPHSIYTLFGKYVQTQIEKTANLLESIRLFYDARHLAGLPTATKGTPLSVSTAMNAVTAFDVFSDALAGVAPSSSDVDIAQQAIQDCVDAVVPSLTILTKHEARVSLLAALSELETAYGAAQWADLDGYVGKFDRSAIGASAFQSIAAKVRDRLLAVAFRMSEEFDAGAVALSETLIVVMATAQRILTVLTDYPDVDGSVVVPVFSDIQFPDDAIITTGTQGRTHPDLLVLDGVGTFLLKVSADPASATDSYTGRVRILPPSVAALSFDAEVVEEPLVSGTFESVPSLVLSGIGGTPVAPFPDGGTYGPHLEHLGSYFLANGIANEDRLFQSASGGVFDGYWETVSLLPPSNPHELLDIAADHFEDGISVDYDIYRPAANVLEDSAANFGSSLVGSRVEIGAGTTYVVRVISSTRLELADYILPLRFVNGLATPSGLDAIGQEYEYSIYEQKTALGRTVQISGVSLFSYQVPPRTLVSLTDGTHTYKVSISTVVDDLEFRIREAVPVGSYTALLLHQTVPGDVLQVGGERLLITRILDSQTLFVSPGVSSDLANARARILPAGLGSVTRRFHDASATFITDGVRDGHLLVFSHEGSQMKVGVSAVISERTILLRQPVPVEMENVAYEILSEDDDNTDWITAESTSLAAVLAEDIVAISRLSPSTVQSHAVDDIIVSRPGVPLITVAAPAIITRGGVLGYAHYALLQDRLFGTGATAWPTLDTFRLHLSSVLYSLDDAGSDLLTDTMVLQNPTDGGTITHWLRPATWDLSGVRFGDVLYFEILDTHGSTVTFTRYVRDWSTSDQVLTFFPAVNFANLTTMSSSFDHRRTSVSDSLYELHELELAAEEVQEMMQGLVSPSVPALEAFLDYLQEHGLERARDLLLSADMETLAQSTGQGLSYAGRLEELTAQSAALLGPEEDALLAEDEIW